MNKFKYDELETRTESTQSYLLEIHIEKEPEWRYVSKSYPDNFTTKQIGDYISAFLERNRYKLSKVNYSIRIVTYIQTISTVMITEDIFTNPYVKED